ncbi:MAG: GNAT family N-acetyltransferase [Sedimentisphaerales bacterium]|nr:GNAT family N-acetyltransferase [Sedimentisphaerales bacterium]
MPKDYEIRQPREAERAELFKVFYACFPAAVSIFEMGERGGRPINDYFYGYEPRVMIMDGRIIANVSLCRYQIYLGGKVVPIGGIGSVVTLPEYQRKGYAKILLEERLRNMQEERIDISLLLTDLPWAYQSLGWKVVPQGYQVLDLTDQTNYKVDPDISVIEDLDTVRSIMELYNESAPSINGAIKRIPAYWEDYYFTGPTGFKGSGDRFLFYKKSSELLGYARLHDEETQMLLGEIVAKDWNPDILEKILRSTIRTIHDQGYRKLVLGLQENHPLRKVISNMGLKPVVEIPEGIRELEMINVLAKLPEQARYLKRLHWCYFDKF